MATSSCLVEVGMEPAGDAPSSVVQGPPAVAEQAASAAASTMGVALEHFVQAQQQPRRAPLLVAAMEIKEIVWEPTLPPQLLRMIIQRGKEF